MKNKLLICLFTTIINSITVNAQWTSISPIPLVGVGNDGAVSFTIGSKGYIVAGSSTNKTFAYDTITGAWSFVDSIPAAMGHAFAMGFAINGKGYVVGGDVAGLPQNTVWEFDPSATNHWIQKNNFQGGKRDAGFGFAIGNYGYVGAGNDNVYLYNDIWKYNPVGDSWSLLSASLPIPLLFPASFVIGNKGYILTGGTNPSGVNEVKSMWCVDGSTDSVSAKADLLGGPRQAAYAFSSNSFGYVGGGQTNYTTNLSDMWEYDAANDQWSAAPAPQLLGSAWASTFVIGNTAYAGLGAKFVGTGLTGNVDFFKFEMSTISGVKEKDDKYDISIYPNPVSDYLTVNMKNEKGLVEIYSSAGEIVLNKKINSSESILLNEFPAGIYYVRIVLENKGCVVRKIQVVR